MVPSEALELKIFHFAESAGKARWRPTDFSGLSKAVQFIEDAILVDALTDLHARRLLEFRQWSGESNGWLLYPGGSREYFFRPFEIRVTFSGRKYFERLEAAPAELSRWPTAPSTTQQETAGDESQLSTMQRATSQPILTPAPRHPKAFVSHSGQDRAFVERFAADLWAVGVIAWYSRWEIKAGDSIPAKIDAGIEECEFFIIVLSKNSIRAPWVQTELDAATARKMKGSVRKIIPIKIDECDGFPPIIDSLYREDFSSQPYEAALNRVLDSIFDVDVRPPLGGRSTEQKDEQSK